ncbi:MAG: hypothetical protein ACOZIN_07025 [Myxococcota bacterium]
MLLVWAANPPMGRIQGGWEYIWAAYAITWAASTIYAVSLWLRVRRLREDGGTADKERAR